jgi:Tripartite tricarboxylate transporter TctB family
LERDTETSGADAGAARVGLAAELIIPALGCLLTGYYLVSTSGLSWEAKATGTVVGVVLLALCAVHLARVLLRAAHGAGRFDFGDLFADTPFNRQRLQLLVLTLAFIVGARWIGTTLGLFLVVIAGMWVLGVRNWRQLVTISAITSATVYFLLIWLLNTRLPRGIPEQILDRLLGGGG